MTGRVQRAWEIYAEEFELNPQDMRARETFFSGAYTVGMIVALAPGEAVEDLAVELREFGATQIAREQGRIH